eukprot:jgi/Botrbrau1/18650/Bobra.0367s0086.1
MVAHPAVDLDAQDMKGLSVKEAELTKSSSSLSSDADLPWGTLTHWERCKLLVTKALTEGHTFKDGILVVAACQIGQIMLVMPKAMWMTGVVGGLLVMFVTVICGAWTVYLLVCFFQEYKQRKLMDGTWYDSDNGTRRRHVTQYHEVMDYFVGRWLCIVTKLIVLIVLIGAAVAQIVACASDFYYISQNYSKRTYGLIWGGAMMAFIFIPSFNHLRVFNLLALVGTLYTNWYLIGQSAHRLIHEQPISGTVMMYPRTLSGFFGGGVILMGALGSHVISMEIIEVMKNSQKFFWAFAIAEAYVLTITVPHSVIVNFAFPDKIGRNDNVYGVMPLNDWMRASVWLMISHQVMVFGLVCLPIFFIAEKALGIHLKPIWIRYTVRIPIALLIYFIAIAFPFYSAINAVFSALGTPAVSFVIPCLAYNWIYRSRAAREAAAMPPPRIFKKDSWNWSFAFAANYVMAFVFGVFGAGFGIFFAFYNLAAAAKTFGIFPECFQCLPPAQLASSVHAHPPAAMLGALPSG